MTGKSSEVPKYCLVLWHNSNNKFSVQLTSSIVNKKQLDDPNLIDDIPWVLQGNKPKDGWELHQGVVLKLGSMYIL